MTDVVELIKAQHRQVEALLQQAEQSEPEEMVSVLQQVADLLKPHSEAEESFIYPAIRDYDSSEGEEVNDGVAEHHHIEGLLAELLAEDPSGPGYDGKLAALIGELRHHVEEEEQDLLPVLADKANAEEREELGARFSEVTGWLESEPGTGSGGRGRDRQGADKQPVDDAGGATRAELYEQAKEQQVAGRSTMTKDQLAQALGDG